VPVWALAAFTQDKYYGGYPPRPPALIGPAYYNQTVEKN
jgi:hypothetical protein